nr:MAG TPA: hypothetical protein [Caudoviricetes sp.]
MSRNEHEMWKINIENAASAVAAEFGSSAVNSVFARYNAHGFHDLSSCYFSEVFADLEIMTNEN